MRADLLHRTAERLGCVIGNRAKVRQNKQHRRHKHSRGDEGDQHAVFVDSKPGGIWALKGKDQGVFRGPAGRGLRRTAFAFGFADLAGFASVGISSPS